MDLIKNLKNNEDFMNVFSHYFDDDQLRFLFIVILFIGIILLFSGIKYAVLFWVIAFGLLAFLLIFIKPKQHSTIETFICNSWQHLEDEMIGVSMIENETKQTERQTERQTEMQTENCQIKFRNSSRNKN
jgi:hypothetical protein